MKYLLASLIVSLALLGGCSDEGVKAPVEIRPFIDDLKANGVDGTLLVRPPFNEDMEYIAEYAIARIASTRIISVFKFRDAEKAQTNLQESLKNDKLSGQVRNGRFVMVATFYPPDEEAVAKIKALFLAQEFE
ncbi:MAG TPA: hypothetical protein ENK49_12420 [Gammaproteobacteria bacterium]|nr:hypothetical protein [Gammaproteobacteria bacterium]